MLNSYHLNPIMYFGSFLKFLKKTSYCTNSESRKRPFSVLKLKWRLNINKIK